MSAQTTFAVGDRVRIIAPGRLWHGVEGRIVSRWDDRCWLVDGRFGNGLRRIPILPRYLRRIEVAA